MLQAKSPFASQPGPYARFMQLIGLPTKPRYPGRFCPSNIKLCIGSLSGFNNPEKQKIHKQPRHFIITIENATYSAVPFLAENFQFPAMGLQFLGRTEAGRIRCRPSTTAANIFRIFDLASHGFQLD
jgi:hypothetical protein